MARKRSAGNGRRVVNFNAKISYLDLPNTNHIKHLDTLIKYHRRSTALQEAEDRRRYTPSPYTPLLRNGVPVRSYQIKRPNPFSTTDDRWIYRGPNLRTIRIVNHTSALAKQREGHGPLRRVLAEKIGFGNSTNVMICVRRKRRKEVIFAKMYAGRGGRARVKFRAPRRNYFSQVVC